MRHKLGVNIHYNLIIHENWPHPTLYPDAQICIALFQFNIGWIDFRKESWFRLHDSKVKFEETNQSRKNKQKNYTVVGKEKFDGHASKI